MENSEILVSNLSLPRRFNLIPSLGESWGTCSSADSEPNTTRRKKTSVDTWCMCFNCSQINDEGVLVLS